MVRFLPVLALLLAACSSPEPKPRPSGAWSSLDWMTQARAYPQPDVPAAGVSEAFDLKRRAFKTQDFEQEPWEAIGPHNVAGRMLSVVFNPQRPRTLLAGSASGGLWRSYSGGEGTSAWHRIETGFPVLAASAVAYAPDDSSTIYLGTGEVYNYQDRDGRGVTYRPSRGSYGMGILVSRDGGTSWSKTLDWAAEQGRGVQMITVNPLRPASVWAATTEGLYVSYNAGRSWTNVHPVIMATDVSLHPADTSLVLAAHGNLGTPGNGLYRSLDGGATWSRTTEGLPATWRGKALITQAPSDPNVAYATIGNGFTSSDGNWLVRTLDGGATWEVMQETTNFVGSQGWYSHDVSISPDNIDHITVVGFLIYTSTDGGRVLNPQTEWTGWTNPTPPIGGHDGVPQWTHPDHHAIAVHPEDADYHLFATDGGIYRTTTGGAPFEALNGGLQTVQFYAGMSNNPQVPQVAMAGTQDNSTLLYRGTLQWRILNGGDGAWTAIDPEQPNRVYWSSQYLAMRRSTDSGLSSQGVAPPGNNRPTGFVAPFVLSPVNPARLYAGRDRVYMSSNRGASWGTGNGGNPLTGEPLVSLAASSQSADVVYAVTAPGIERARVLVSRSGAVRWQDITGTLPDRYLVDIALDPQDDNRAFVAVAGFGTPHVYRTEDGGASWSAAISGLPDVPTWSVVVDPQTPNRVYAGNDVGVYVSSDGGDTWEPFDEGLPEALIAMDLAISEAATADDATRRLRVATHGNGMFQRALEGTGSEPELPIFNQFELLTVFPNPAREAITVTYVLDSRQDVLLTLHDASGRRAKTVIDGPVNSGRAFDRIPTADLPAGIYYVTIRSQDVNTTTPVSIVR
ncbi:MAG: T9SS type A sorting domain-containing protein [Rhodothermales bacterium]|nr:T9SS type A sorting domain-containing protein [Rhodothermales bacterium]MBO6778351.1 T9SS type A sorting domain-containing protein [Rhodothermales bacterium]